MPRRMTTTVLLIMLIGIMMLGGCAWKQKPSSELIPVNLVEVVHSIFYAPQYVAISEGFFKDEGLDIKLSTAQGTDKVMAALLSGTADIGLGGSEAPIYVYNQGKEDYVVNFAQLTQCDGSFLVGRQPEPDFTWEKLKGKTIIGGRPGGMPEMVLEYILQEHGLKPGRDVNLITNLQFTATAGAFKGGTGDYVALFEPTATLLEQEGAGYVVASLGQSSGQIPYTVFMARKSQIANNPEMIQKFTNAIYRGQIWVDLHSPREIAQSIAVFFPDIDIEALTRVVARYKSQETWSRNPLMNEESFRFAQKIIQNAGELDNTVEPAVLIDQQFAKKAMVER